MLQVALYGKKDIDLIIWSLQDRLEDTNCSIGAVLGIDWAWRGALMASVRWEINISFAARNEATPTCFVIDKTYLNRISAKMQSINSADKSVFQKVALLSWFDTAIKTYGWSDAKHIGEMMKRWNNDRVFAKVGKFR